jgi:PAS domain S-box-containing protein
LIKNINNTGKLSISARITLIYIIVAALWILFSDKLFLKLAQDSGILMEISILKGWFFVIVTASLLYFTIKKYVNKLKDSEEHFKAVWSNSIDAMRIIDSKGIIRDVNDSFCKMIDRSRDMIIGLPFTEIYPPDLKKKIMNNYNEKYLSETLETKIIREIHLWSGKIIEAEISNSFIKGNDEEKLVLSIFRDISERKSSEVKIIEAKELLEKITSAIPALITVYDVKTEQNIFKNRSLLDSLGYTKEQKEQFLMSEKRAEIIHPDDMQRDEEIYRNLDKMQANVTYSFEYRIKDASGKWQWLRRLTNVFHRDPEGKPEKLINVYINISEQKFADEKLKESEELYKSLVETSPNGISLIDLNGKIIFCNKQKAILYGYNSPDEIIGRNVFDFISDKYKQKAVDVLQNLQTIEKISNLVLDIVKKDGTELTAEYSSTLLKGSDGKPYAFIAVMNDITERVKFEQKINSSEEFNRTLIENSPIGISVRKQTGQLISYNQAWQKIWGMSEDEIKTDMERQRDKLLFDERDNYLNDWQTKLRKIYDEGGVLYIPELQLKPISKNRALWISQHFYAIKNQDGIVERVVILTEDISTRKETEEKILEIENRYKSLFESSMDCVFVMDFEGNFLDANPSALNLLGYTREDLPDINIRQLIYEEEYNKAFILINETISKRIMEKIAEFRLKHKNGFDIYAEVTATLLYKEGKPFALQGIARDVTAKKSADNTIKASLNEKEILLKEIHHRVKNNLQVISSMLRLQSEYIEDKLGKEIFRESQNRVMSMALVHEKLYRTQDLAMIDIDDYIKNLINNLYQSYGVKYSLIKYYVNCNNIKLNIETTIPLGLILNELITNIFKHAFGIDREGSITVSLEKVNERELKLQIKDTGIGFSKEIDFRNTKTLGLQLVITLCKQLGGTIEMSVIDGTSFIICFEEVKYKERN